MVDDDPDYLDCFCRHLNVERLFAAHTPNHAVELANANQPAYAVVDAFLGPFVSTGFVLVKDLLISLPNLKIVMMSGAATTAYEQEAVLAGAETLIRKLGTALETVWHVESVLFGLEDIDCETADSARWRQIALALDTCDFNISAAARRLGWRRTSLQKILKNQEPPRFVREMLQRSRRRSVSVA